jgi:hypothetical protein
MKCTAYGCKHEATREIKTLWGKKEVIGFCEKHTPNFLTDLKIGEISQPSTVCGITQSWYQRVK